MLVKHNERVIFRLFPTPGKLVSASKKSPKQVECAFASGESLSLQAEESIFAAATKAKDWEGLIFKLRLEGYDVAEGEALKLPFGKL